MKKLLAMFTMVAVLGCTVIGCAEDKKPAVPAKEKDKTPAMPAKEKDKA